MRQEKITADRLAAFSDAVFAVIVTVMVLELKAPDQSAFRALWPLWPTVISYAVSYLFIAIIWVNDHYLMRFVGAPTLRLIWISFVHLFMVSFLPFATAWTARTRLASSPVVFYAGLFVCIDICLQRLRARSVDPRGRRGCFRAHAAHGEAPIPHCPGELHDRYAGCVCRATPRLRSDLGRLDPPLAARGSPWQPAVTISQIDDDVANRL
jgi:hypothetical protein